MSTYSRLKIIPRVESITDLEKYECLRKRRPIHPHTTIDRKNESIYKLIKGWDIEYTVFVDTIYLSLHSLDEPNDSRGF